MEATVFNDGHFKLYALHYTFSVLVWITRSDPHMTWEKFDELS